MNTAAPALSVTAIFAHHPGRRQAIPLFLAKVSAGFPSPADDFLERKIDLNEHLVRHPAATFFVRVAGDSMKNAGIFCGDILVVDRSLEAGDGSVVVAVLDGEFTVKRVLKTDGRIFLVPANEAYSPVEVTAEMDFTVWGVVTSVIHSLRA
ncbi:MAG: translesion error-prone DNA polymerase V autoproteolytic subunit [Gammaproteobacteria bacterium]|jgi:DNA polymerase V